MIPAKIYPLVIPANGSFPLQATGRLVKVLSATGAFKLSGDVFGSIGSILAGQGVRLDDTSPVYQRLTFEDLSGAANTLSVLVADDGFIDDRITGEVSVIDGELARSIAGTAFMGFANQAAVAAQFGYLEIWNPAGSLTRVIVSDVMFSSPGAAGVATYQLRRLAANIAAAAGAPNKSSAGALSTCKVGGGTIGALPGTGVEITTLLGNTPFPRVFKQPFVIEPNSGLLISSSTVNVDVYASVQFTERLVVV